MSLINQALKKEQQRRSPNLKSPSVDIPVYESEPLTASSLSRGRQPKNTLAVLVGFTGLGLVLLVCGGAFVYFGKSYLSNLNPTPLVATDSNGASQATSLASAAPAIANTLAANQQSDEATDAVSADNSDSSLPPLAPLSGDTPLQESGAVLSPQSANEEPTLEAPKLQIAIQAAIDELHVHGFRSNGANSRLLMNGRVFQLNDIVNHELVIRFKGSTQGSLIFEDDQGFEYQKAL
jgi:hypothetical protein